MASTIKVSEFGIIISDRETGDSLLAEIKKSLESNDKVFLDFQNVVSMATFSSKQIFGNLYLSLTPEVFFERLVFQNVNDDVQLLIKIGIQSALEEK